MEDLLLIIIVFLAAMFVILAHVFISDERGKEEFELYMKDHPELNRGYVHDHST